MRSYLGASIYRMDVLGDAFGLLIAAGFGGFFWQYVLRGTERREARAKVRDALSSVEEAKFTHELSEQASDAFRAKRRAFVTAGMVARLPCELVDAYSRSAITYAAASKERLQHEGTVSIDGALSDHLDGYAALVSDYLWRPLHGRLTYRRDLSRLVAEREELQASGRPDARFLGYAYVEA
jgi:hypothetical protein